MQIFRLTASTPITGFASHAASSAELASGSGEAHAHVVAFAPGGVIGRHPAGFAQLFAPIAGSGWVAGADDVRHAIAVGQCAFVARHEHHSKGSNEGMTALMLQVRDLELLMDPAVRP